LLTIALIFGAFAVAAFTARTASERGRNAIAWTALGLLAGLAAAVGSLFVLGGALRSDDTQSSVSSVMFGFVAWTVGPLAGMVAVLGILWKLPERVPTIGGTRWPVRRLSSRDEPAADCDLSVEGGVVRLGEIIIANGALTEVVADGECLRLGWDNRSVTLMPAGKERTPKQKAKQSQALEKRLRQLLG
jgi:hypothetical protein